MVASPSSGERWLSFVTEPSPTDHWFGVVLLGMVAVLGVMVVCYASEATKLATRVAVGACIALFVGLSVLVFIHYDLPYIQGDRQCDPAHFDCTDF